ncbi:hypothetical protein Bca52824_058943 [Brassica carinata]|uniref:Uncharacterized protein n=1 Tax=Brassica carinata TaxID=52824 RepID=A0A8X7QVL7_BRACI|nr:hypothetical protein Bca52824_058943 [Brassica carinata]
MVPGRLRLSRKRVVCEDLGSGPSLVETAGLSVHCGVARSDLIGRPELSAVVKIEITVVAGLTYAISLFDELKEDRILCLERSSPWRDVVLVVIGSLKASGPIILKEDRLESDRVGICTGYGTEPSLDGSVLNGLRLRLELDSSMAGCSALLEKSYPINLPKSWRQPRGLFKSMDPNSEVKKRERLTKCILKLKDNKLAEVRIEASGSRKPRMLRKSLNSRQNSRVDELKVVNGNRVGQVVRGLRWNLNELAKAIDGLLRDNLKESGNRETELDKSSMEEPKD